MRTHRSNPSRPRTLDLEAAANFLQISKEELRRRVKKGVVRGAKPGKCWAFLEDDLVDYFRSLYPENQAGISENDEATCSTDAGKRGGLILPHQSAREFDAVLAQRIKPRHKNSMTSSRSSIGENHD